MSDNDYPSARPFLPEKRSLESLSKAVHDCQGCPLYKNADQAVFGVGSTDADIMLVGGQPGETEDGTGRPFVGSAGEALDRAIQQMGLNRDELYITNAVKHAKFEGTDGKGHTVEPNDDEIDACFPWLSTELELVDPRAIVAMGPVAARSLTGQFIDVEEHLDTWTEIADGRELVVTYEPTASLREPGNSEEKSRFEAICRALDQARIQVSTGRPGSGARRR